MSSDLNFFDKKPQAEILENLNRKTYVRLHAQLHNVAKLLAELICLMGHTGAYKSSPGLTGALKSLLWLTGAH